jgi:hypothetical protein
MKPGNNDCIKNWLRDGIEGEANCKFLIRPGLGVEIIEAQVTQCRLCTLDRHLKQNNYPN